MRKFLTLQHSDLIYSSTVVLTYTHTVTIQQRREHARSKSGSEENFFIMLFHSCFPQFFWFIRRQQRKTLISYYFHRIQRWKLHIHMIARNWKLLHYTYNHHHLVDMSIIDCKLSFGCLIIWNLILCVSSSRTRYKIQEPSWLSRVRCEVMSLKLLHFYIDYRPSCVFMWVVGFFVFKRVKFHKSKPTDRKCVFHEKCRQQHNTIFECSHDTIFRRNQADEKHAENTPSNFNWTWKFLFFTVPARSVSSFLHRASYIQKWNIIRISLVFIVICMRIFKMMMLCWCNDNDGRERSERKNTRRFNNSRFNLSAPYPGIKTIKSARSLISSFSIRTNLLLIFMNPRCCCCSHFPKIRKRYAKSFSSLPTHSIVVVIVAVPYDYTHVEWTRSLNFCWTWATQFYPYFLHLHARSVCIMNNKQRHWRLRGGGELRSFSSSEKISTKTFPKWRGFL